MKQPFNIASLSELLFKGVTVQYPTSLIELPPVKWKALPGGHLEFNDSGFVITLTGDPNRVPYELADPDGRVVAMGLDLQSLKQVAEKWAGDRKEFDL